MPGDMVKVDRGDGHIFKMTRKAAERFMSGNPKAHIRGASEAQLSHRAAAPAAADSALGTMTRAELDAYAASLGLDGGGAANKGEVIAMIEEAQKTT